MPTAEEMTMVNEYDGDKKFAYETEKFFAGRRYFFEFDELMFPPSRFKLH